MRTLLALLAATTAAEPLDDKTIRKAVKLWARDEANEGGRRVRLRPRRQEDKEVHDPLQRRRRPGGRRLQKDVRHVLGAVPTPRARREQVLHPESPHV